MGSTEIDLHGYTVSEAISLFVSRYNNCVDRGRLASITVVHGYGSTGYGGRIRTALLKILQSNDDCLSYENDQVNPGRTVVRPEKRLPPGAGIISGEILVYCLIGKTESKILGKFRRYGDLNVKKTLQALVRQGKLQVSRKGRHRLYTAT